MMPSSASGVPVITFAIGSGAVAGSLGRMRAISGRDANRRSPRAGAASRALRPVGTRLLPHLPSGERKPQDRPVDGAELTVERAGVVRELVAVADVAHPRRDLGVAARGHVGEQVVLD